MSVLFMMPNWITPSEVWLQRMLEGLQDHLGAVVVWSTEGATSWRGRIRAVSLNQPASLPYRFLSRFGIRTTDNSPQQILQREIQRPSITHVLCHYGDFALRFMETWQTVDVPLFVHLHGYDATLDVRRHEEPDKPYFDKSYRSDLLKLAQRAVLIANSQFTKSLLIDAGIPTDCIQVKYLGVPVPKVGKVHSKHEGIHILHLGRLVDFKSPDRTIMAFEIARSEGLKGHLTIAGDGPLRVTCELLRARSPFGDSIQILGSVTAEHAQELLKNADIFTQHNILGELGRQQEGFGVSILEAMAAGLPVVGTRSAAVSETVINGETGFLVEPGDVGGQAEAFLQLAADPSLRQRLGGAGRKRVADYFSLEHEMARLREIMGLV